MNQVCAVVVTYNRKELLVRNIRALLTQTMRPDIIIYDNCSTDGTEEYLRFQGILQEKGLTYYHAESNTGGAGGFSGGLKLAMENGYEAYMLMDDDGFPETEYCIEQLWKCYKKLGNAYVILNPLVVSDQEGRLSFSLFGQKYARELDDLSRSGLLFDEIAPFNGTFLPREVVEKIGVPLAELFIYGDEFEYITRAVKNGIRLATCMNAKYYHPYSPVQERRILGKKVEFRELDFWRTYYFTRNYQYVFITYYGMIKTLKHSAKVLLKSFLYREHKFKKICITIRALYDGFRRDLGRNQTFSASIIKSSK